METTFAENNYHEHGEEDQMLDQPYKPAHPCYNSRH